MLVASISPYPVTRSSPFVSAPSGFGGDGGWSCIPLSAKRSHLLRVPLSCSIKHRSIPIRGHVAIATRLLDVKKEDAIHAHKQDGAPLRDLDGFVPRRPRPLQFAPTAEATFEEELVSLAQLREVGGPRALATVRVGLDGVGEVGRGRGGLGVEAEDGRKQIAGHRESLPVVAAVKERRRSYESKVSR